MRMCLRSLTGLLVFGLLCLGLLSVATAQAPAPTLSDRTFYIVNASGDSITSVFITRASASDNWGNDVLGSDALAAGARRGFRTEGDECFFNIRVVYMFSHTEDRLRQNLCQLTELHMGRNGNPRLALVNRSSQTITTIFASVPFTREWGANRLGQSVLGRGERFSLALPRGACIWDVAVEYSDQRREYKNLLNLCDLTELAFDGSAARVQSAGGDRGPQRLPGAPSPAVTENPSFNLVNRAPRKINEIYARLAGQSDWGADRLGNYALPAGRIFRVALPKGECSWDLAVVYEDGRREERRSQNLCAITELAFDASGVQGGPGTARPPAAGAQPSFGTGFFISSQGHMLTNAHVVGDCRRIAVLLELGPVPATLVRKDERNDLALIKVEVRAPVPFARFRAQPAIRPGDNIVVAGFPLPQVLQNGLNVTTGNVSAMAGMGGNIALMQITAPVQPGNSGGPLLDLAGNVVGVIVSKLNAQRIAQQTGDIPQNVNFAVQGAVARLFLDAGGQRYGEASSQREMRAADVGELSRKFTFQIECR